MSRVTPLEPIAIGNAVVMQRASEAYGRTRIGTCKN